MKSPITELFDAITTSPYRVAPEVASDLDEIIREKTLTIDFCDNSKLIAEVVISKNIIRLGVPFLEVLWSAAHAYIVIFHEYQLANNRHEVLFNVSGTDRTAAAYKLYRESLLAHICGNPILWSSHKVMPIQFPQVGTDGYVANELFLVAISWIIHHEIAHSRLDHQEFTTTSILQEQDADRAATKWICEGTKETMPLHKRSMGIITAIILLIAYDIENGRKHNHLYPLGGIV